MRLKSVFISKYKNLKGFYLSFDGNSFIDIFVGKNGSGKSNLLEALIEIFRHLYEHDHDKKIPEFDYSLGYEIEGADNEIAWRAGQFFINGGKGQKTVGSIPLPDNVLIYYSGHNDTVRGLVNQYEETFRKRIKGANPEDSRRFIGIGSEYKQLLLATMLLQQESNKARQFICEKLGIASMSSEMRLVLNRPDFADGRLKRELKADGIENFDPRTHYWGADGITREFLDNLISCVKGEFNHGNLYDQDKDQYEITIDIELFRKLFAGVHVPDQFRQLDNLKVLGMLTEITIALTLSSGEAAATNAFSDGQFQSVYIYSIVEIFKDRNCITLLDEPDSFLHPEWQFDFLKQVLEITDATAKNNHVLMSSHSGVTLIPHTEKNVKLFHFNAGKLCCHSVNKRYAINQLSSDMMRYSESEQILSVLHSINIERKPILFTEGSTDPLILKEAWVKLFSDPIPFIPIYAFNCIYLKHVLQDERILNELRGKPIFGLFDFDEAYNEWNHLKGNRAQTDPYHGMRIDIDGKNSYAFIMPVPQIPAIERQVIRNNATKETYLHKSRLAIEHLFYEDARAKAFFFSEDIPGGSVLVFNDNSKTHFAEEIVPTIDKTHFEVFRPMFDFIKSKCL